MNIIFITPWYPNKNDPVSDIFVKELAKAASIYHNVAIIHEYHDSSVNKFMISDNIEKCIKVIRVSYPNLKIDTLLYLLDIYFIFKAIRYLKDFKPDIIQAHVSHIGIIAVILGKFYKISVVITEHAKIIDKYKLGFYELKNFVKIVLVKFALNNAHILILVSKSLGEYMESFGIKNKYRIISNIMYTNPFYSIFHKNDSIKKILFIRGYTPIKGVLYMFEVISLIKNNLNSFYKTHLEVYYDDNNKNRRTTLYLG